MAVCFLVRIMFVSLHSNRGAHIDKYYMDGSSRFHFIEKDLIGPMITLAYDPQLERLFYADQGSGKIISTHVQGKTLNIVNILTIFEQVWTCI